MDISTSFRENDKTINNALYLSEKYSTANVRVVNHTECPFIDGHNICLNKALKWTIFLKQGSLDIRSLVPGSMYVNDFITRFCNNSFHKHSE